MAVASLWPLVVHGLVVMVHSMWTMWEAAGTEVVDVEVEVVLGNCCWMLLSVLVVVPSVLVATA